MVRAPGFDERRLMSRRASTSLWISYSDGWRRGVAIGNERGGQRVILANLGALWRRRVEFVQVVKEPKESGGTS